jgi:1-acyl-sn-glycerol-3-phosphate acyltransferase
MPTGQPYTPRNARWLNRLLRQSLGRILVRYFRIGASWTEAARAIRPPYVLVANHVTLIDAFILSAFVPAPIYWITADGNMRSSVMRAILRYVGSIPKSKAIPDIETVGQTVRVIRKRKGVVGICPEGQTSWNGVSQPLAPATAKLLKLLKVPVLAAVIRGGYSSYPRWASSPRRGRIEIDFSAAFQPRELKAAGVDETAARLEASLAGDESAWGAERGIAFSSTRRAEGLELALFMCPSCRSVGTLRGRGIGFRCESCGAASLLDSRYRFRQALGERPPFEGIKEWDAWQDSAFERLILAGARERPALPLLSDEDVVLERGRRLRPQRRVASGRLLLYPDRLEMERASGGRLSFALADMEGVGVLKKRLLEFNLGRSLYQARLPKPSASARKWHMAIEVLRRVGEKS